MSAIGTKLFSDLRRRKLQSWVIAVVILLSSFAATLALSLLVETDSPYDHAFAQANGAHLVLTFAANAVTPGELRDTAHARGVTATAGPWLQAPVALTASGQNQLAPVLTIVGRAWPDTTVDRLTVESGRWARTPAEIVLSQRVADALGLGVGDQLTATSAPGTPMLTVVGIAASISPGVDVWALPHEVQALVGRGMPTLQYQMLYRVTPAATAADLRAATQAITAQLPAGALQNASNYLDVKRNADLLSAVMIPFLLAFSAFALLAAALIIANVVAGVVIAGYREIGIMKSIGFAPGQVMLVLLGQILTPALAGSLIGIPLGTLASQPFLRDTAHALGLPAPFTAVLPVDLLVLAAASAVAALAAFVPAWRAAHMSAVVAITMGSAPPVGRSSRLSGALSRAPLPRPLSLGAGDALARPARSAATTAAILTGVVTLVFSLSLHLSLGQVADHLIRGRYVQVIVDRPTQGGRPGFAKGPQPPGQQNVPQITDARTVALLRSNPATVRFVAEQGDDVLVPGVAEPIPFTAYRGPSSWIGYAVIAGRWFSGPGEVVAPTRLLTQTHLQIGDTFTAHLHGKAMRLRLVGEILDQEGDDLLLRGDWRTLAAVDPSMQPATYEVQLHPGADPERYTMQIRDQAGGALDASVAERSDANTSFILLNMVIGGLALVLTAIAVAGVFNTVVLSTREKARDVAILKALGMAPRQVVTMVIASVALIGLLAGGLGVPLGLALHRQILLFMGQVASGTGIPPAFFDLISHAALPLLALTGVAVAAIGAWVPAHWAARSGVVAVLQTE